LAGTLSKELCDVWNCQVGSASRWHQQVLRLVRGRVGLLWSCVSTSQPRKYGVTAGEPWLHGSCIDDAEKTGRSISGFRRGSRTSRELWAAAAARGNQRFPSHRLDTVCCATCAPMKRNTLRRQQHRNRDLSTVSCVRSASVSVDVEVIGARPRRVTSDMHIHPCKYGNVASDQGLGLEL